MMKHITNVLDATQPYYKVYCDFHKKDLEHFMKIKNDIFDICKCSIFYYEDEGKVSDQSDRKFNIENANLYVLIVSSNVLFDPDFDMESYQIASKSNIPILPILVENGLEEVFNERFGNLQCISTCLEVQDPTAVPYIEKLQNFLSQSFSLSLNVNEIRSSFDTSIFLSYRKKDRFYAQKLLEAIHSSDKLKNIAIWYDEFLVPGEDFNDNIKAELENSAIFMLLVTPSILEEKNYIKIVEYPIAQSLNKSIIPVETVPTNISELQSSYPDIPPTVNVLEAEQLKNMILEVLEENGIVINERTAERDFFIGFAFLKGLYVEKNTAIALEMIEHSANAGMLDAMKMLALIYKYGDGCAIDTPKAVAWQKEYIQHVLTCFQNSPTQENAEMVLEAYKELADIFVRDNNTMDAADAFSEIVEFLNASPFKDDIFAKKHSAEAYESAAMLFMNKGDYSKARYDYIEADINLRKELYESYSVENAVVDLAVAYLYLARCQSESDDIIGLKSTIRVLSKGIAKQLLEYGISSVQTESMRTVQKALYGLSSLGQYYNQLNKQEEAFIYIGAAVNLSEAINQRYNTINTKLLAYHAFKNDGQQHIKINVENHLRYAKSAFEEAHDIAMTLLNQSETSEIYLIAAESYINLARIMHKFKEKDVAIEHLNAGFALYKKIFTSIQTIPAKQKLYQSYYAAAEIYAELKRYEDAQILLDQGLEINDEIVQTSHLSIYKLEMAEALMQKGEVMKKQWEFDEALDCFAKRHELVIAGAHKNVHIYLIAESFEKLIAAHKSLGNFEEVSELKAELMEFKRKYSFMFDGSVHLYS